MSLSSCHFVADGEALRAHSLRLSLNLRGCPFCRRCGTLNRHSFLYGNALDSPNGRELRGQRFLCCPRGRRGGCGRTFPVFLAGVLPRHSVNASSLWTLLCLLLTGVSVRAAYGSLSAPFALDTFYHLLARLRGRLDGLRSLLHRRLPPPDSAQRLPLLQTVEHLRAAFPDASCPLAAFQESFQSPLMEMGLPGGARLRRGQITPCAVPCSVTGFGRQHHLPMRLRARPPPLCTASKQKPSCPVSEAPLSGRGRFLPA